ncbi:hypothetical protein CH373_04725 [Leptospira perolatii]|uniref:Dolichyl-phosphate-mannose--protein mannosyltransferase n=1 Tax=Leptospira perolatii TaxID=2023191 RepID=A0A2M9ZQ67_9LEPT|nr:glycosyltransferase 87 family protein [Leptospira perolatii]PJZ68313.1 hypothetical protein CH360_16870 [Leptospira perolatii]PJZ74220.1 hypothetical protein CH373_04725 [Leptospira perolatii]
MVQDFIISLQKATKRILAKISPVFSLLLWALPLLIFPLYSERSNTLVLFLAFGLSLSGFSIYLVSLKSGGSERLGILFGIVIRAVLIFYPVFLSEDVYRFLWDGTLFYEGISPFSSAPENLEPSLISELSPQIKNELLQKMNSKGFHSVYPPILQILFAVSSIGMLKFQSVSVGIILWKTILFLFELGVLYLFANSRSIAKPKLFLLYWLHPLVLWEGIGNGHAEPILVFFLIFSLESYRRKKIFLASLSFLAAILTKLVPLLFLPFLFFRKITGISKEQISRKVVLVPLISATFVFVCSFLFFFWISSDSFFSNFLELLKAQWKSGIGVYFRLFEFHGLMYYLWKWILQQFGLNFYQAGIHLAILSGVFILISSWKEARLETENGQEIIPRTAKFWILCLGIYYCFSTTIHSWYLLPLLAISVFTGFFWPIVAASVWILSYSTYGNVPYKDSYIIMLLEFGLVAIAFFWDVKRKNQKIQKIFDEPSV